MLLTKMEYLGLDIPSPVKWQHKDKIHEIMIFKTLDLWKWWTVIPKRQEKRWITQCLQVTALGSSWAVGQRRGSQAESSRLPELWKWNRDYDREFLGQSTKEKRDAKRKELQRSAEDASPIVSRLHISASMWDNYPSQGKTEGIESGIHRGLGIVAARFENNKIKNT